MKIFGLKKILGGVLLGLAVVAVLPMATMTVKAALPEEATCRIHPDSDHWKYKGTYHGSTYFEGVKYYKDGSINGDFSLYNSSIYGSPSTDVWYYNNGSNYYLICDGHSSDPEPDPSPSSDNKEDSEFHEHDHDSGSNDDDSRPAPPSPHQSAQTAIFSSLDSQLASSNTQATIDGKDLVNALPSATMQKIAENPNVTVFFTYTYNDAKYTTAIPAGTAIDSTVEWYGPIYMMTHFPTMWHQDANTSVPVVAPVQ